MIQRFVIKGFKRFREETVIALDPVTVLVGLNGSGKSTVLQAMALFQVCLDATSRVNGNGPITSRALKAVTVYPGDFGVLPAAEPADLWPDGRLSPKRKPAPIRLRAELANGASVSFAFRLNFNRFRIEPTTSGDWWPVLDGRELRFVPLLSALLPREEYLTPPARQERLRMQRHAEMIRNLLWNLRETAGNRYRKLTELLQELFPDSRLDVRFDIEVDRFLTADYRDEALLRDRDIAAAGSGFHQALQILTSVLAPGVGTLLLDEPDAHLHARLQSRLTDILVRLAAEEKIQFVMATHAPQILEAAPEGGIRVCADGRVEEFAAGTGSLSLLQDLGALDRMEIVPLLTYRAVVFVENRSDRKLLELFARRHWGEARFQQTWRRLSFLYVYGSGAEPSVLGSARQIHDLLVGAGIRSGPSPRMMVIGDRDWRTDEHRSQTLRDLEAKADEYPVSVRFQMWERNEIENYLLDRDAAVAALDEQSEAIGVAQLWRGERHQFIEEWRRLVNSQEEQVRRNVATRIQQHDRRLELGTAMERADRFLNARQSGAEHLCDAKLVISGLRRWLQDRALPLRIRETDLVAKLPAVPREVQDVLGALEGLGRPS